MSNYQQEIQKQLLELAEEEYKKFQSNLCPGIHSILGVRVPTLQKLAKQIAKENGKRYLEEVIPEYYEELMLQGMVLGAMKIPLPDFLEQLEVFIPKIDNWAVCDVCTSRFKIIEKHPKEVWQFIQKYIHSDKEFEVRFAVIVMLDFFLTPEYIKEVLNVINTIHHEGYYVKMAVAWLISVAYVKFKEDTEAFLNNNQLDNFTYNKAIQKIIESNRVIKEEKDMLRRRKRKE